LVVAFALVGCSNACPPPVACYEAHPDYCPCRLADGGFDTGVVPPSDANDQPDAFVGDDAGGDAGTDASASDATAD
jgi:hypothetical protein